MRNTLDLQSTTLNKLIDASNNFLNKLVGPAIKETGLLISDSVKIWRLKNQVKNLEKVQKIIKEKKISIRQVDLKVLVPYLDGVSIEENETLQVMWANLLAHYVDANSNITSNVFPNLLKQISSNDVTILKYIQKNGKLEFDYHGKNEKIKFENYELDNLTRLGILEPMSDFSVYDKGSDCMGEREYGVEEDMPVGYTLTSLGNMLLEVCGVS